MNLRKTIIAIYVLLALFSILVYLVANNMTETFDLAFVNFLQKFRYEPLNTIGIAITSLASKRQVTIIISLAIIFLLLKKKPAFAIFLALTNGLSPLLNDVLKNWFMRSRPNIDPYFNYASFSFPSGHATAAMVMFASLTVVVAILAKKNLKKMTVLSAIMVLLIGITRPYLGVHYPTDILGGYLIGLAWTFFLVLVFSVILKNNRRCKWNKSLL